ncbi:MAG: DUF6167 family protein [Nocardioidaceae bacterium]|jgi:hypothetical protein|nr:hypothetical protein [Nocardioidaceae bacterium]
MKSRVVWFAVGTTAGIYTSVKARRIAYRLTPTGISDQVGALGVGFRAFGAEVRAGMAERETQIADELGLTAPLPRARVVSELESQESKDND